MVNKIDSIYECPFDVYLLKFIDTHLDFYYKNGFTPNMITTFSIIFGLLSMYFIFNNNYKIASFLFLIAYYFDCVDGKLARKYNMQTTFGDYYDHFGDIFKIIIIIYALYKTNPPQFNEIKMLLIILALLMFIHLGYQEAIYNTNESPTLSFSKYFADKDDNPRRTIQYTKYYGCGTFVLLLFILIFTWNDKNIYIN
jgi:phosphatidylglycerophosphate synthase